MATRSDRLRRTGTANAGAGALAGGAATATLTGTAARYANVVGTANGGSVDSGTGAGSANATSRAVEQASGGYAHATSAASSTTSTHVTALATSQGVDAANLDSRATGIGAGGTATATSTATSGASTVVANAVAPVSGTASSDASATFNAAASLNFPNLASGSNGLHAFAYGNGAPNPTTVASLLATHAHVAASLAAGATSLGLGTLGANYGTGAIGARTYDASTSYSFSLGGARDLSLGLMGLTSYNGGFDSLHFTVTSGSATLVNDTFTTLAAAQTFFNDHAVNLGNFAAGSQTISIDYALTASSAKGSDVRYLLSSLAPVTSAATPAAPSDTKRGFRPTTGGAIVAGLQPTMAGSALVGRLTGLARAGLGAVARLRGTAAALEPTSTSAPGMSEILRRDR